MQLLLAFIPLIFIATLNLGTVLLSKRKYGTVLPLTLFAICFTMFMSQALFSTFYVAYILLALASVASVVYAIILATNKRDSFAKLKFNYFSTGFFVSAISYLIFLAIFYFTDFSAWDNFSHWGPMAKEMLRLDKLYTVPEAAVPFHKDYPPIVGMFEVFFIRFTGYREGILILATQFLQFSALLPVIEHIKKHRIIKGIAVVFLAAMATLFLDQHGIYNSIYIDYILAFYGAFSLYIAIFAKLDKFNIFYLLVSMLFLSFIKEIAVVLSGIVALAILIRSIQKHGRKQFFKQLLIPFAVCLIALAGFLGWKFFIRDVESERQFDLSKASNQPIVCPIMLNCEDDWRNTAAINFYKAVPSLDITNSWINLSFLQVMAGTILIYVLIYRRTNRKKEDKNRLKTIIICYTAGAIVYSGVMFFTYTTLFDSYEGPNLASFNRYMNTYLLIGLGLALYYYATESIERDTYSLFVICCISLLVQTPSSIARIIPAPTSYAESNYAKNLSQEIENNETVNIYYHAPHIYNIFRYFALDNYMQTQAQPLASGDVDIATIVNDNNERFMPLDLTTKELNSLQQKYGHEFQNGHIYSLKMLK